MYKRKKKSLEYEGVLLMIATILIGRIINYRAFVLCCIFCVYTCIAYSIMKKCRISLEVFIVTYFIFTPLLFKLSITTLNLFFMSYILY